MVDEDDSDPVTFGEIEMVSFAGEKCFRLKNRRLKRDPQQEKLTEEQQGTWLNRTGGGAGGEKTAGKGAGGWNSKTSFIL